jgi:Domain of unknown function (DUF4105)
MGNDGAGHRLACDRRGCLWPVVGWRDGLVSRTSQNTVGRWPRLLCGRPDISVVGDERDLVRVRTNYRHGEDLYLHRTSATPAFAQSLFLKLRWPVYNAVTHNCTTEIYTPKA